MKKLQLYILWLFIGIIFFSCEEAFFAEVPQDSPTSLFDQAWTFADQEYTFFDYKGIDWDSVYREFRPLVNDDMGEEDLFQVIADMLYLLRDGHVNLRSKFDRSRNWSWFLDSPENFNYSLLERNYFNENQQFVGTLIVMDFGDVGYMRYSSFSSAVSSENLNYVIDKFKDHKGLIIDVRNNGGGLLANATKIARRFTNIPRNVVQIYYKNGPDHNDLDGPNITTIEPASKTFNRPVVVLTNRHSYSATSFFSQYMKALDNVTLIGDWTGGGGGAPAFTELTNGWEIRVSSTLTTDMMDFNIEDGVPPDIKIDMLKSDEDQGKDTILETALEFIRNL